MKEDKKSKNSSQKKKMEEKENTIINSQELNGLIEEDMGELQESSSNWKHILLNGFLVIVLLLSLVYFGISIFDKDALLLSFINHLLLTIFTILFVAIGITYNQKKRGIVTIGSIVLASYFIINMLGTSSIVVSPIRTVENFSGKNLTYVMKWAEKNHIQINQEYEYSDMIEEYMIISQNVQSGTKLKDIDEITVSVSEGPNPSKEIMVPSMLTWDSERVIHFIKDNYLSNVTVEFVQSDKAPNTVIEQNTSGNLKRDDEIRLIFSYGEELGFSEVAIPDFTGQSKFEVEFFMKQHQLRYDFNEEFHEKIKKGHAIDQSVYAGKFVKVNDEKVIVTFSKGPKIVVPNFKGYTLEKVTEWAIQNRLKLKFSNQYDDSIKENGIISANYKEGDIIEQGTVVEFVLSRGALKMPKFNSLTDFYTWADKYQIAYEEVHEFSDSIPAGEVIRYSYKTGEAIKNQDTIRVTISDGSKKTVPNVKGLTKNEAASRLEKAGLNVSFVYRNSNSVEKGKVINQSISAGSEVSGGTTVTVTISNGPSATPTPDPTPTPDSTPTPDPTPQPDPEPPTPQCNSCSIYGTRSVVLENLSGGYNAVESALRSHIQSQCPGITINITGDDTSGKAPGMLLGNPEGEYTSCSTINIVLAK